MALGIENIDWENSPTGREKIYFAVFFLLLVVLFAKVWWLPQQSGIARIQAKTETLQMQAEALEKLIETTDVQVQQAIAARSRGNASTSEADARVFRILKQLNHNPTQELAIITHELSGRRMLEGLEFRGLEAMPKIDSSSYAIMPLKVSVMGTYNNVQRYLRKVEELEKPIVVDQIKVEQVEGRPGLVIVDLMVYLYSGRTTIPIQANAGAIKK
jgi:Tfp pilus assembly protein PilO